jgi:hypothetical protein
MRWSTLPLVGILLVMGLGCGRRPASGETGTRGSVRENANSSQ